VGREAPDRSEPAIQLQRLLDERVRSLTETAVQSRGDVGAEEVAALDRLARLADIARSLTSSVRPLRWPVVALAVVGLVVSALVFAPMPATDVELSAVVSGVRFELAVAQTLTDATSLDALGAAGLHRIEIPSSCVRGARVPVSLEGAPVRLSAEGRGAARGRLALSALTLPVGTVVRVHHAERPREYRVSLGAVTRALNATVHGPIRLTVSGGPDVIVDCATPRLVALVGGPDGLDLDLAFLDSLPTRRQLRVRQLVLQRVEGGRGHGAPADRPVSTLVSGTLYFQLNGAERKLRAGEMIRFAASEGEIRTLRWAADHLDLDFHARVRGMTTGQGDGHRSLMPSPMDWLRATQGDVAMIWSAALSVIGCALTVFRWWRNPT